ncbi:acyl carrier protein [Methylocella sp. CPCC 101449]|uniref:acyl carrier protein n=1 Tax=Methylocella sp. CPCC 101449 TaxID=2987531 RepID=UPI001ACA983D|nr:acyl carrier protein [Methylocella sp. CPCC 101449]MBN9081925.1 acyl carrier protein [Hyphomicrobiales bacterium]MDT2021322.1 acyl carrier protein [Methylocella sp. CPCC 101449]HEV2571414.1 acyl carrier protein [Beijerinckiaceae bacterium]
MPETRAEIAERIMGFMRSEMQDKSIEFSMDTPLEGVKIDSIDVIHVIFKVEEEYGATVDMAPDSKFATVGEFVNALIDFIPADKKVDA